MVRKYWTLWSTFVATRGSYICHMYNISLKTIFVNRKLSSWR